MPAIEDKSSLRQQMLLQRKALSPAVATARGQSLCQYLQEWPLYQQAATVMAYLAMPGEPNLDRLLAAAISAGKTVCVPLMGPVYGMMESAAFTDFSQLTTGRLGVRMPASQHCRIVDPGLVDLVLVPGVAFDRDGGRLGMGAGYYDRFLLRAPQAVRTGVSWSRQLVKQVPREDHDLTMQWLATECGLIRCG